MSASCDLAEARRLDAADELAPLRERFVLDERDVVYLAGNSLGRLPRAAVTATERAVREGWGRRLIRGWNEGWIDAPRSLGEKIAGVVGARADEVLVAETTSIDLFKLAAAALAARPGRRRIVTDALNFPSDLYVLQGLVRLLGDRHELVSVPSRDGVTIAEVDLAAAVDATTALVVLSHVSFISAFLYDLARVTELVHHCGALVLWDLSHSAGAVPVELESSGADLAVGCTYKYLNGGPGAPAFLYVRRDLQRELEQPLFGWLGHAEPFAFEAAYRPAPDLKRFCVSTPPVLSLLAMEPGVDLVLEAGVDRLRTKSVEQSELLLTLADAWLAPVGVELASPRDPEQRGSHVALRHPEAWRINRALLEPTPGAPTVIADFRAPDAIRLGIAPLYTTFQEVWLAADRLRQVVASREYERFSAERPLVT
jgi:kynureninase